MIDKTIEVERMEHVISVFGSFDQNLRIIENELSVKVLDRDNMIHICGEEESVMLAEKAINGLLTLAAKGENIDAQNVRYILKLVSEGKETKINELAGDVVCITAKGKPIKPKTLGQKAYCDAIAKNTITLGIGPAGTGKTISPSLPPSPLSVPRRSTASSSPVPPSKRGSASAFCPATCRARSTRTCARCMTRCSICSAPIPIRNILSAAISRSHPLPTCAAELWTIASLFSMRRRTPPASR